MKNYLVVLSVSVVMASSSLAQEPEPCRRGSEGRVCRPEVPRPAEPVGPVVQPVVAPVARPVEPQRPDTDIETLRRAGIDHVEPTGSTIWTDPNTHDPGLSLIDTLCYGLTDLACRTAIAEANGRDPEAKPDSEPDR